MLTNTLVCSIRFVSGDQIPMQRMKKLQDFFPNISNPEITKIFRGRRDGRRLMDQKQFVSGDAVEVKTVPEFSTQEEENRYCFARLLTEDFRAIKSRGSVRRKFQIVLIFELKEYIR